MSKIMIENLIYWAGVVSLLSLSLLILMASIWFIFLLVQSHIIKDLKSTYNHVQLFWFMKEVKKKGYAKALDDLGKD